MTGPRKPVSMDVSGTGEVGKGQGLQGPMDHPDGGKDVGSPGQGTGGFLVREILGSVSSSPHPRLLTPARSPGLRM